MKPFTNNQTKRRTTLVAILVWLLALASGMANARLLEAPGTLAHATTPGHSETAQAAASSKDDSMADADHDDDADGTKEACLKSRDDVSSAPVKLKADYGLFDPGQAPFVPIAWNAKSPALMAPGHKYDLQPLVVGPLWGSPSQVLAIGAIDAQSLALGGSRSLLCSPMSC